MCIDIVNVHSQNVVRQCETECITKICEYIKQE